MLWCVLFFFFKQKTAYELRISAWSSDVCSSDLRQRPCGLQVCGADGQRLPCIGDLQAGNVVDEAQRGLALDVAARHPVPQALVDIHVGQQERLVVAPVPAMQVPIGGDRKSTRLNSSH